MTCHFGAVARLPSSPAPWTLWSLYARDKAGAVSRPGGPWGRTPEHQNTSLLPFKHGLSDSELILAGPRTEKRYSVFISDIIVGACRHVQWAQSNRKKKPCCHFCVFWRAVWKLFAWTVDTAAARKNFLMRTTTVSQAHHRIPDKPASAEPSRRTNHILYLWIEVTYFRFDYQHMRHLLNKWIPEILFHFLFSVFVWVAFLDNLSHSVAVWATSCKKCCQALCPRRVSPGLSVMKLILLMQNACSRTEQSCDSLRSGRAFRKRILWPLKTFSVLEFINQSDFCPPNANKAKCLYKGVKSRSCQDIPVWRGVLDVTKNVKCQNVDYVVEFNCKLSWQQRFKNMEWEKGMYLFYAIM